MFVLSKRQSIELTPFCEYFGVPSITVEYKDKCDEAILSRLQGCTFGDGLLKFFPNNEIQKWNVIANEVFTAMEGKCKVFAYDWMGRCFCLDYRKNKELGSVFILDIATIKMYETDAPLAKFLNELTPTFPNETYSTEYYDEWLAVHYPVGNMECAGFKIPLMVGGKDELDNLEIYSLEGYWNFTYQIWEAVKDLPPGTKIENIRYE